MDQSEHRTRWPQGQRLRRRIGRKYIRVLTRLTSVGNARARSTLLPAPRTGQRRIRDTFLQRVPNMALARHWWECSKLQKTVALSTMKAEYMAICEASKEAVWLSKLVQSAETQRLRTAISGGPINIKLDNSGCIDSGSGEHFGRCGLFERCSRLGEAGEP